MSTKKLNELHKSYPNITNSIKMDRNGVIYLESDSLPEFYQKAYKAINDDYTMRQLQNDLTARASTWATYDAAVNINQSRIEAKNILGLIPQLKQLISDINNCNS